MCSNYRVTVSSLPASACVQGRRHHSPSGGVGEGLPMPPRGACPRAPGAPRLLLVHPVGRRPLRLGRRRTPFAQPVMYQSGDAILETGGRWRMRQRTSCAPE